MHNIVKKMCSKINYEIAFLVICWNEIRTVLTPSTSEGDEWAGGSISKWRSQGFTTFIAEKEIPSHSGVPR